MRLDATHLQALARGCAILGSGGGGDPDLGLQMALAQLDDGRAVDLVDLADLEDDAMVMACGMLGSPTLAEERLWSGDEGAQLAAVAAEIAGAPVVALMCVSIGGVSGMLGPAWAARCRLPLVDADLMGRSFPSLDRTSLRVAGIDQPPLLLTDGHGTTIVVRPAGGDADRVARASAAGLDGACAVAFGCLPAATLRRGAIIGSVSRARALGEDGHDGVVVLVDGRVAEVERGATGSVAGFAVVHGVGDDSGRRLRLELSEEIVLALEDGAVRAVVPDVIAVRSAESAQPIAIEQLRPGQRVTVVGVPAPAPWRTPAGLALAGPRAFGLDTDHVAIGDGETDGQG